MTTNKSNDSTSPFDMLRRFDGKVEYWPARELMTLMGYQQWSEFFGLWTRSRLKRDEYYVKKG